MIEREREREKEREREGGRERERERENIDGSILYAPSMSVKKEKNMEKITPC